MHGAACKAPERKTKCMHGGASIERENVEVKQTRKHGHKPCLFQVGRYTLDNTRNRGGRRRGVRWLVSQLVIQPGQPASRYESAAAARLLCNINPFVIGAGFIYSFPLELANVTFRERKQMRLRVSVVTVKGTNLFCWYCRQPASRQPCAGLIGALFCTRGNATRRRLIDLGRRRSSTRAVPWAYISQSPKKVQPIVGRAGGSRRKRRNRVDRCWKLLF